MTTTNAERINRYRARQRSEDMPVMRHGAPIKRRVIIDYDAAPRCWQTWRRRASKR
jgi:hypothetical protein